MSTPPVLGGEGLRSHLNVPWYPPRWIPWAVPTSGPGVPGVGGRQASAGVGEALLPPLNLVGGIRLEGSKKPHAGQSLWFPRSALSS